MPPSIFEVDFSETYLITNAENSVLKPPNLEIFCGRTETTPPPTTRLVLSALAVVTPVTKTYLRPWTASGISRNLSVPKFLYHLPLFSNFRKFWLFSQALSPSHLSCIVQIRTNSVFIPESGKYMDPGLWNCRILQPGIQREDIQNPANVWNLACRTGVF